MDTRDLEYFLACCTGGSPDAAARTVHTDGQAITAAIARLEQYFGTPLFDHTVNPATLTVQGIALRAAAPRILEAVQAARDGLAAVARLAVRRLRRGHAPDHPQTGRYVLTSPVRGILPGVPRTPGRGGTGRAAAARRLHLQAGAADPVPGGAGEIPDAR